MSDGALVLLGSGETAPGMTKVHREVLQRLSEVRAVNLNTPYGFQLNVPQMSEKLEEYFATSLRVSLETLDFTSYARASAIERSIFKQRVREANYVFAGPGSPTYALAQWRPLDFGDDLTAVMDLGGILCFASAAALTLGAFTAPIYEIYKVGDESPTWRAGLGVTSAFGLDCVVIPHFDNAEGMNYDTRYCYLGEPRLRALESQLPEGVATLGIDEHTALIIDRAADTITVLGRSEGHWRLGGHVTTLANGSTTPLSALRGAESAAAHSAVPTPDATTETVEEPLALAATVEAGGPDAHEALVRLVRLASTGGEGFIDPDPIVEQLLALRRDAREAGHFAFADRLRDAVIEAGFDVSDAPTGTTWSRRTTS